MYTHRQVYTCIYMYIFYICVHIFICIYLCRYPTFLFIYILCFKQMLYTATFIKHIDEDYPNHTIFQSEWCFIISFTFHEPYQFESLSNLRMGLREAETFFSNLYGWNRLLKKLKSCRTLICTIYTNTSIGILELLSLFWGQWAPHVRKFLSDVLVHLMHHN